MVFKNSKEEETKSKIQKKEVLTTSRTAALGFEHLSLNKKSLSLAQKEIKKLRKM